MPIHGGLWRLNANANPHAYFLGKRISEHKRMNKGKANEDTMAVSTLLAAIPNLPEYAAVMEGSGHVDQQIMRPFERDMNALDFMVSWSYIGSPPADYGEFEAAKIVFDWRDYPDMKKLEDGKQKRAARQAKKGPTE
jgi:hypothetical protein